MPRNFIKENREYLAIFNNPSKLSKSQELLQDNTDESIFFSKAPPGTSEWKAFQAKRFKLLRKLKSYNDYKLQKQLDSVNEILKKDNSLMNSQQFRSISKSKEPASANPEAPNQPKHASSRAPVPSKGTWKSGSSVSSVRWRDPIIQEPEHNRLDKSISESSSAITLQYVQANRKRYIPRARTASNVTLKSSASNESDSKDINTETSFRSRKKTVGKKGTKKVSNAKSSERMSILSRASTSRNRSLSPAVTKKKKTKTFSKPLISKKASLKQESFIDVKVKDPKAVRYGTQSSIRPKVDEKNLARVEKQPLSFEQWAKETNQKSRSIDSFDTILSFGDTSAGKSNNEREDWNNPLKDEEASLKKPLAASNIKPPEVPKIDVCDVFPGTQEWDSYWSKFEADISEYQTAMERFGQNMDRYSEDLKRYSEELHKEYLESNLVKLSLGLTPADLNRDHKPPLYREPLKGVKIIGGYVIRAAGIDALPGATLTTYDHSSFTLEIDFEDWNIDSENILVEKNREFNLVIVSVRRENPRSGALEDKLRLVQIGPPVDKSIDDIAIGYPLENGGKLIINGN